MRFTFCAAMLLLTSVSTSFEQQKKLTVVDYYLQLPGEFFQKPDFDKWKNKSLREYRESAIEIKDIPNGYLKIHEPVRDGWAEVALFKFKGGDYVVGISQTDCGPGCGGEIAFRQKGTGDPYDWYNMTNTVMPTISRAKIESALKRHHLPFDVTDLVYVLPRVGTTIKVQNAGDYYDVDFKPTVLFELNWTGLNFILKDK